MNLDGVAMDDAHLALISGVVRAHKPDRVLELGVGSGRCTEALFNALYLNQMGTLLSVDNWLDWNGEEPLHVDGLRQRGGDRLRILVGDERSTLTSFGDNAFGLIVSDADHHHAGEWLPEYVRILAPGGFLFFHDTNATHYPTLYDLPNRLQRRGFACHHFTACSRQDERCGRGLLMAQKPLAQLDQ